MKIGSTFAAELAAAGLRDGISWDAETGTLTFGSDVSEVQQAAADAVLAVHDPAKQPPPPPRQQLGNWFLAALQDLGWLTWFDQAAAAQITAGKPLDKRRYDTIGKADVVLATDSKLQRVAAKAALLGAAATPPVAGIALIAVFDRADQLAAAS